MFKFLKITFFIALVTVLSLLATEKPGQVMIEWFNFELRSTVPVFLLVLLITIIILKIFVLSPLRFINKIFSVPKNIAKKNKKKEKEKEKEKKELAQKENLALTSNKNNPATNDFNQELAILPSGFLALHTNDFIVLEDAYKKALTFNDLKTTPFTKLLEAFVLEAKNKKDEAMKLFNELYLLENGNGVSLIASQKVIEHSLATKNKEKAFMIAQKIYEKRNDLKWVADTYFSLLIDKKLWRDALTLLDTAASKNLLAEAKYKRLKAAIFYELALKEKDAGDLEEAMKYAISANETDHSFDAAAILVASYYASRGMDKKAAGALSRAWRIRPIPDVAHAYVRIWKDESVYENVQRVEQLTLAHNKHPLNDLMLAEYNIRAGLWGPVKKHLDNYMSRYPTTKKVAQLMAEFEEGGNKDREAAKEWLSDVENSEPDQMWICSKCYGQFKKWQTVCSYCNSFATIEWLTPGRTLEQEIEFEKSGMKK